MSKKYAAPGNRDSRAGARPIRGDYISTDRRDVIHAALATAGTIGLKSALVHGAVRVEPYDLVLLPFGLVVPAVASHVASTSEWWRTYLDSAIFGAGAAFLCAVTRFQAGNVALCGVSAAVAFEASKFFGSEAMQTNHTVKSRFSVALYMRAAASCTSALSSRGA